MPQRLTCVSRCFPGPNAVPCFDKLSNRASAGSATARGAVKLHIGLDHEGLLPAFVAMTEGKTDDLTAARALRLPKGSIVVMDRGYTDYAWYKQLNNNGISFVTRLKTNVRYRIIASAGSATASAEPCSKTKA